jgi:hypothetical protein
VQVLSNAAARGTGHEVFNNYGAHKSNEELLAMYGFALPNNRADRVMLLIPSQDMAESPTMCHVDRGGITAELLDALTRSAASVLGVGGVSGAGSGVGAASTADTGEESAMADAVELAAVAALQKAVAAKLDRLRRTTPSDAAYSRAATAAAAAAAAAAVAAVADGSRRSKHCHYHSHHFDRRCNSVQHYRKGLEDVLETTLRECEAVAAVIAGADNEF